MDVIEAIKTRKSIRAFSTTPVPKELLAEIVETALRSPSFGNTQPWEFAIVGGAVMNELKQALADKFLSGAIPNPDIPWPNFAEPYKTRSKEAGHKIFNVLGIAREDKEARQQWTSKGLRFFGAPNAIVIYIDKSLNAWSILDVGIMVQTIMLAAHSHGLGTCTLAGVAQYPDEFRRILGIPNSKLIICGLAIGYSDTKHPVNKLQSDRDTLKTFVTWHGM